MYSYTNYYPISRANYIDVSWEIGGLSSGLVLIAELTLYFNIKF